MKLRALWILLPLLAAPWAAAQQTGALPEGYSSLSTPVAADKAMVAHADSSRSQLESSLGNYLVAFDAHYDSPRKQVGLPLATLADDSLHIAYDPSGKNVMAQWKFAQTSAMGQKFNYQAYVGGAGVVNFVISSRF